MHQRNIPRRLRRRVMFHDAWQARGHRSTGGCRPRKAEMRVQFPLTPPTFRASCEVGFEAGRNPAVHRTRGFDSSHAHVPEIHDAAVSGCACITVHGKPPLKWGVVQPVACPPLKRKIPDRPRAPQPCVCGVRATRDPARVETAGASPAARTPSTRSARSGRAFHA